MSARTVSTAVPPVDWLALAPVAVIVATLLAVLLVDALLPRRSDFGVSSVSARVLDGVALTGLVAAATAVAALGAGLERVPGGSRDTLCVNGSAPDGGSLCSFVVSPFTLTLQAVVLAFATVCLLLAMDSTGARDRAAHHVLFLSAVAGAVALAGARDLVTLLVALETASLPAVALVGLRRDAPGVQGALTLLLTAVGSLGLLALGLGLLLTAGGTLHTQTLAVALADPTLPAGVRAVAGLGVLFAVSGIAFKLSAVPFHLWTPDTYAGAPLPVAAFLSVVSKAAALAALLVLLALAAPALAQVWAPVLGVVAVLTMTVGNVLALRQQVAVRLLAWSTVAQAGWLLLPLAAAGPRFAVAGGSAPGLRQAVAASVGYLVAYGAAGVTAFAVVVVLSRHVEAGQWHTLEAYRGLARREPVAAAVLGLALAALAGLPPGVIGLVAKVLAVRPVVDAQLWPLAVAAAVNVALGVAYYLRWAALLVTAPRPDVEAVTWRVRPAEGLAIGAGAVSLVVLSVLPQLVAGLLPGALS